MKMLMNECKIEIIRIFRNPYFVFWSLFMPILFYFLFTKVFNTGMDDQDLWNKHFLMSIAVFSVMGSAIMTLGIRMVQERNEGWTTWIKVTPLPSSSYFISKMIGQSAIHLFSIAVIFLSGVILNGVSMSFVDWLSCAAWILIGSYPFLALGVLVGTMKRVDTASGVSNIIYLSLAISGGLWMPMEVLPKTIQTIGSWLPAYHYGNGAWGIIRGQLPEFKSIGILAIYLLIFMVLSIYIRRKQEAV